jgi:hypothetical protein
VVEMVGILLPSTFITPPWDTSWLTMRRGAWRGPNGPGSASGASPNGNGRVNSPIISGPPGGSKSSIQDQYVWLYLERDRANIVSMADLGKVDDKSRKGMSHIQSVNPTNV